MSVTPEVNRSYITGILNDRFDPVEVLILFINYSNRSVTYILSG